MISRKAVLTPYNGNQKSTKDIQILDISETKDSDFLVTQSEDSLYRIIVVQGQIELPKGEYTFNKGIFWIRQHQISFNGDLLCIFLNDPTLVTVHQSESFQVQSGDKIKSGAIIKIDPAFDTQTNKCQNFEGWFTLTL